MNHHPDGIHLALVRCKTTMKGARLMKFKSLLMIFAAIFLFATILPNDAEAGRGGGKMGGQSGQSQNQQTQSMQQNRVREQQHSQSGDGKAQSEAVQQKGNTYGPGDGTGNQGVRPQDGTGYGAPANR
jgi:hypothetical protein